MDEVSSHKTDGTHNTREVKLKTATAGGKLTVTMTFKERALQGIEEAAKAKGLSPRQWILETLENQMIKEGTLPEWWHSRSF